MPAPIRGAWCALRKAARAGGYCISNLPSGIGWLGGFLLPCERVAGGMVPKYLLERIEAILRGSPLPARGAEREQVRARWWFAGGLAVPQLRWIFKSWKG